MSVRKFYAYFTNTIIPRLSKVSSEQSKPVSDSHTFTQDIDPKLNQATEVERQAYKTGMEIKTIVCFYCSRYICGDTFWVTHYCLQARSVSKLRCHSHRGQRLPSCGVHSALETTSGFVCLEMRTWGSSETPWTQTLPQEFFTLLTFTGVILSHPSIGYYECIHVLSVQCVIGYQQKSIAIVGFFQQAHTDFPQWDVVSVFSKFCNDKDKAITKVTLTFNN